MPFPFQSTGEFKFLLNAKTTLNNDLKNILCLFCPLLFFIAFQDLSHLFKSLYFQHFVFALIITSLFIYSFFFSPSLQSLLPSVFHFFQQHYL